MQGLYRCPHCGVLILNPKNDYHGGPNHTPSCPGPLESVSFEAFAQAYSEAGGEVTGIDVTVGLRVD